MPSDKLKELYGRFLQLYLNPTGTKNLEKPVKNNPGLREGLKTFPIKKMEYYT